MPEQPKYGSFDQEPRTIIELYLRECEASEWFRAKQPFCTPETMADEMVRYLWEAGFHIQRHDDYQVAKESRDAMTAAAAEYKSEHPWLAPSPEFSKEPGTA